MFWFRYGLSTMVCLHCKFDTLRISLEDKCFSGSEVISLVSSRTAVTKLPAHPVSLPSIIFFPSLLTVSLSNPVMKSSLCTFPVTLQIAPFKHCQPHKWGSLVAFPVPWSSPVLLLAILPWGKFSPNPQLPIPQFPVAWHSGSLSFLSKHLL